VTAFALYEATFQHHAFTGRSGTMYKYEGLGCTYWHMVSKLVLAIQENAIQARARGEDVTALVGAYYRVRGGLGAAKTPAEYGAFPVDPYSHTPAHMGAQQPGMTGQVKEGVLIRMAELGLRVADGRLSFDPFLLRPSELLGEPGRFEALDVDQQAVRVDLPAGSLAFTVCQVPVVYRTDGQAGRVVVLLADGRQETYGRDGLSAERSASVFCRSGEVSWIEVYIASSDLQGPA
jgi:hypothetical protein